MTLPVRAWPQVQLGNVGGNLRDGKSCGVMGGGELWVVEPGEHLVGALLFLLLMGKKTVPNLSSFLPCLFLLSLFSNI